MPSRDQCHKWKLNIKNVLEDPDGFKSFQEYLKKHEKDCEKEEGEFTRYTDFWKECQDYKKMDGATQEKIAVEIFNSYLDYEAIKKLEIEESDNTIQTLRTKLFTQNEGDSPTNFKSVFDDAELGIIQYLDGGRGCSQAYKDFCKDLKPDKKLRRFQCRLM
ncbi:unnamed protein product [Meganyctiphanes norvegica]|uniref:RGS domain-containing protein n=1 Tax=Meganyctiphanes norvegica TaxID=48144 RepID=A0AAV2SWF9_MEGNR